MPSSRRKKKAFSKKEFLQRRQEEDEKKKLDDAYCKQKGIEAFISENFNEALNYFSMAIKMNKKSSVLYSNRSATYSAMKNYAKSLNDANKTIELKKDWGKGYYRKGSAYEKLLRYHEARSSYQAGLKVDPGNPLLLKSLQDLSILLDELKIKEEDLEQDNPDSDAFKKMVKWLRNGGTEFPKLFMQYYEQDYRGVHCLTKIPRHEVILFVPFKYIMTSDVAKASRIGKKIKQSKIQLQSMHSYLASFLLQEKHKKESFWDPYLNILPNHYANMPIFFKEDLLSWLKGSFSLQKIADRIDSLRREYDNIRVAVEEFNKFHLDDFVWARLVVITRIFGLKIDKQKTDGLVPYADMLNHKIPNETTWTFDNSRYGFIITTLKTYQRGDEVFDSYGRKCNHRYFVNYGFTMEKNKDNEALIQICLSQTDPMYIIKKKILGGHELTTKREYQIPAIYGSKKVNEFFSFLRFVHADSNEILLNAKTIRPEILEGVKNDDIKPISVKNEKDSLQTIDNLCKKHLEAFPHSLDHDYKQLRSGELKMYSNERNAVIMRGGEKEVLTWLCNFATRALESFEKPLNELKRITKEYYRSSDPINTYIKDVVLILVKRAS